MFGRIFAAMILLSTAILAMNFFIVILNDALAEAKNTAKESPLYDPGVDECSWKKTNQRHQFYDKISNGLRQWKLEEMLAQSSIRKKASGNPKQKNSEKRSFFDQGSNIIVYPKHARNEHHCHLNKKGKKVCFAEDVTKSQLRRLQATKKDLFQRLDSIVQAYSREAEQEEKFELIMNEMGVHNSLDPMINVTAFSNESFEYHERHH
ncbi:uncharacterized protein LOC110057024 [Orbicella faveolata]|uniref:uncharacterized protein LOC110057024 n=1 Tax=Orbicella faveolata TaxID=48498 RepID=UPI0009E37F1B|nr:uncharacterized protein LOC110057024 [Orbicella faveolata]